jgi:polyisoprenoid-binding protein YceI
VGNRRALSLRSIHRWGEPGAAVSGPQGRDEEDTMTGATLTATTRRAPILPRAGTWQIDPQRAVVAFSGKASFLTPTISARFLTVTGSVQVGEDLIGGQVDVAVDLTTMTTGNRAWDEVITSVDPFDAATSPVATYRSTAVRWSGDEARIEGVLTMRGVTRAVPLTASYVVGRSLGTMLVRAGGSIDREDFGIRFDVPGCGKLVPRTLRLEIDVDAVFVG